MKSAGEVASYHMATLPWTNRCLALGEAGRDRTRLAVVLHQVDVELDGFAGLGRRDLGVPVSVVPATAEGVDDGAERRTLLAPAGKAAQADAVLLLVGLVERLGELGDLRPTSAARAWSARPPRRGPCGRTANELSP